MNIALKLTEDFILTVQIDQLKQNPLLDMPGYVIGLVMHIGFHWVCQYEIKGYKSED